MLQTLLLSFWLIAGSMSRIPDKTRYPANYKKSILFFGQGGGFTGMVTTYALLDNGRFFKKNSLTHPEFEYIGRMARAETSQLFTNYTFLGLPSMTINDPGNIYYFVEYSLKKNNHRLTWGGSNPAPENLKLFYTLLYHFIPKP